MEKIRINAIEKKPSGLVIVKYFGKDGVKEATLNTKWQSQEVDYLEKDVGINGDCSVLIVQKGDYTNITKVDMASAVKGNAPIAQVTPVVKSKGDVIGAMCLTKIEYRNAANPKPLEIMESYRFYLKELDE